MIGSDARYVTLDQVRILLAVAAEDSVRQGDIERTLRISQSTVNRVADRLSRSSKRGEGLGFMERVDDEADGRYRVLRLTETGTVLAKRWAEEVAAAFATLSAT